MSPGARSRGLRRPRLVPALPRPAWVVLGGDFANSVGSGLTLPFLFVYAHQIRHLSDGVSGLVFPTIALASLVGNPLGGALADRWTPRRALMAGLAIAAAGSAALALARTVAELFAAAGLLGLGVALIWPARDALLASLAGPAARSAVFAARHACLNAGLGLGALAAATVVSATDPPPSPPSTWPTPPRSWPSRPWSPGCAQSLRPPASRPRPANRPRPDHKAPGSVTCCGTGLSSGSGRSPQCW